MVKKLTTRGGEGEFLVWLEGVVKYSPQTVGVYFIGTNTNSIAYQRRWRERLDRTSGCGTGSVKCHIRRVD